MSRDATLSIGTRLGPYEVVDRLGHGGMGEVYRAHDTRLGRHVALKVLPGATAMDRDALARLMREARAAAALSHPGLCTIYDVGEEQGIAYLALELLEGETMRQRLARGELAREELLEAGIALADAIDSMHRAGIVHRDLKPENVMRTSSGVWKILDFGVARRLQSSSQAASIPALTETGVFVGTAAYGSPEQLTGRAVDGRSDVFSLGAMLYEAATGQRAFAGDTLEAVLYAIVNSAPRPLSSWNANLSGRCEIALMRALEKDPERRFATAADLRDELMAIRQDADRSSRPKADDLARVVAVLPFESIAAGEGTDYFAAGMSEEIIGQLSRIGALRVSSRTSVARYRGTSENLRTIARELGVGSVVTGSVRLAGPRVRITVQLVDARDDRTLWSDQYDRQIEDIFEVQTDVALRIADALKAHLTPREREDVERRPTADPVAYRLYLRSRTLRDMNESAMKSAIELLNMALELDPGFAEAHADLARRYMFMFYLSDPKMKEPCLAHGRRAVELGPRVAVAWFAYGDALGTVGKYQESRQAYLKAVEIDPQFGPAMADLSLAEVELGRYDDGFYWAYRGQQADPANRSARFHVTVPLLMLDELELVSRYVRRFAPVDPSPRLPRSGYWAELLRGDADQAIAGMRALCRKHPDDQELRLSLTEMASFAALPEALELLGQPANGLPHVPGDFVPHTYALMTAGALLQAGNEREANSLLDACQAEDTRQLTAGDSPRIRVRLACIHALRGDAAGAQRWLDEAYVTGWRGGRISSRDPMLASLRDTPEFQAWLERIDADVARMRERAKAAEVLTELG